MASCIGRRLHSARSWMAAGLLVATLSGAEYEQRQGAATARLQILRLDQATVEIPLGGTLLTLSVRGRAPLKVTAAESALDSPGWHANPVGKPRHGPSGDLHESWEQAFLLTPPLTAGENILKLAPLRVLEGNGAEHVVRWEPIPVRLIHLVAGSANPDISRARDITGIEELPAAASGSRNFWAALALLVIGLLAAAWGLRRRLGQQVELTPERWANLELDRIDQMALPAAGQCERFHTLLADVVRQYLERRFGLPATRQTTAEFLRTMRLCLELPSAQQEPLRLFLERCDQAKFARTDLSAEDCQASAAMARTFVQQAEMVRIGNT